MVDQVLEALVEIRQAIIMHVAGTLGVSLDSVQSVLTDKLGMAFFKC